MITTALYTVVPPAVEPVGIDRIRQHLRLDIGDDDLLLDGYATAARELVEQYLNRALITQTLCLVQSHQRHHHLWAAVPMTAPLFIYPLWYPAFLLNGGVVELQRSPLQQVTSIAVGQWDQPDAMLTAGTDYQVDAFTQPGRVRLQGGGGFWPQDHVKITYVAGYGATGTAVPSPIRLAILWLVAFFYENRGDAGGELPKPVQSLLSPYRLFTFG